MSVKKYVSIREAITQLVDETSENYISMIPVLVRWGKQSDLRIGSYYSYKKQYYVRTVINGFVELPLSAVHVLGVIIGNHLSNCPAIFNSRSFISQQSELMSNGEQYIFLWDDMNAGCYPTRFHWEIQDNSIVFPGSMYDGQEVTIASLNYQEDADGWPMIIETHIQAVAEYLKIKLAKKEQWGKFMKGKLGGWDMAMVKELKDDYRFEVRQATARDGDWSDAETQAMGEMIGFPFSGNGSLNLY